MRLVLLVLMMILPLPAAAFTAQNGMTVVRQSQTEIEVIYRARRVDTDYWCAAGDFTQRALGYSNKTPMWRASPKPRRAGQGIIFTIDPAKKAPGAGLSQFGSGPHDGSVTIGMAVGSYCRITMPFWHD